MSTTEEDIIELKVQQSEKKLRDNENRNESQTEQVPKWKKVLLCVYTRLLLKSCFPFTHKKINRIVLFFAAWTLLWLFALIITGEQALPGGLYFSLIVLVVSAHVAGFLIEFIKMPSLLGMLLMGIFYKNVPVISIIGRSVDPHTSSILRNVSFCFILCRAGLSLDLISLAKDKWKILTLSVFPSLFEAFSFAVAAKFILNISFQWAILMGFVVGGVSPAVVVPLMIELKAKNLGESKNIPSIVIAGSCIDNIIAITGHSLLIGIIFNSGVLWWTIVSSPLQIVVGILFGLVMSYSLSIIRMHHIVSLTGQRFIILLLLSLIALIGAVRISFPTSGPLGVLIFTILAKMVWERVDRHILEEHEQDPDVIQRIVSENSNTVSSYFGKLWRIIFLPLLFVLIGNEVDFHKIDLNFIGIVVGLITIGMIFRMVATFFSVFYKSFTMKERLFMCLAWIPKATVQAAVGSMALDLARQHNDPAQMELGTKVLNIAVLSIILTAPIGTLLVSLLAPKLLRAD